MEYARIGGTGLMVSRLCLGCMSYGVPDRGPHPWSLDEAASRPFFREAFDLGINFYDTANVYSDGTSEEITSRAIKEFAPSRDAVVLATKVHGRMRPDPNGRGLSRKAIPVRNRPQPVAAGDRLRRPLPDSPLGRSDADRGDPGGVE